MHILRLILLIPLETSDRNGVNYNYCKIGLCETPSAIQPASQRFHVDRNER
jgi:hypothetical protein